MWPESGFPENDWSNNENYCRSPINKYGQNMAQYQKWPTNMAWCFTSNGTSKYEFCDLPSCISKDFYFI